MPQYNKLVRDHIPDIIRKNGQTPVTRVLSQEDFAIELRKKLQEEVDEYLHDINTEELADILEVVYALAQLHGFDSTQLEQLRMQKAAQRGGFDKRIFLESAD